MTARSPALLHRSFEHEVLLQPCGFTNIAAVHHVPEKSDVRIKPPSETYKRRWLLFVDQRRGLLGRTVLACPTRAAPSPGRRRSYQSYTRSTPTGAIASAQETNFKLPAKPADLWPSQNAQCEQDFAMTRSRTQRGPPSDLDCGVRQDEDRRTGRRSLPLLIKRFTGSAGDGTDCRSNLAVRDNHDHVGERSQDSSPAEGSEPISSGQREAVNRNDGRSVPGALLADNPPRGFTEVSSPLTEDEHSKKTRSDFAIYGAAAAAAAASSVRGVQALSDGMCEDNHEEEGGAVKILLSGLNRPFLVAAAAGGKSMGVFFVDHAFTSKKNGMITTTTNASAVQSQMRAPLDETKRGESLKRTRTSFSTNRPDAGRTGRLRFLPWGAEQPLTLVEDISNPVALCVSSSDSSVFVLEEVSERHQRKDGYRDRNRDRGRPQQYPRRSKLRYQVCRLDGAQLAAWLSNTATRNSAVSGSEFVAPQKNNGQAGTGRIKLNTEEECGPMSFSADNANFPDDDSETEWETSSDSAGDDFSERGNQGFSGSSAGGAREKETGPDSATRSRRLRGVVSFVRVLGLPSASARTTATDDEGHPEQPVDMCVLADGTIVVAFSRAAPLHGGASIAESQGVIRAFPAAGSTARRTRLGGVGSALSSTNTADHQMFAGTPTSAAGASPVSDEYMGHDVDDGWLVAEGLPVVTGLAAGGGDAVYLSLCGARHDGAVTAIGALSTRQRRSLLRTGEPREGVRGRTKKWNGGGESPAGQERMLARGSNGDGGTHTSGEGFVRIASGFAAALAVDDDMNLFYITAENKGSCRALWCSVPGVGGRRAVSLGQSSPLVHATAAETLPTTATSAAAAVPIAAKEKAGTLGTRETGDGESVERCAQFGDAKEGRAFEDRHALRMKAQEEAAEAAAAAAAAVAVAAAAAAKRAAALSAALLEDDDQATSASRIGRKSLFTSRNDSTAGGLQAEGIDAAGFGDENENACEDGRDGEEPVNIAVVSRCRPLLVREMKRGVRAAVFCDGNDIVVSGELLPNKRPRRFGFDRVFGPGTSQARVYAEAVYPVVRKMLDGFNCSVLAYGQTGSGKTFTMEGGLVDPGSAGQERKRSAAAAMANPEDGSGDATAALEIEKIGVIPRAVHTIFREGGSGGTRRYWVYVSHMEIYNERLFDLLAPSETAAEVTANNPAAATAAAFSPPRSPSRRSRRSPSHRSPRIAIGDGSPPPRRTGWSPRAEGVQSPTRKPSPRNGQRNLSPRRAGGSGGGGGGGGGGGIGAGLTIEEDRHLGVVVKGLTQVEVKSPEDIFAIIARSKRSRRTAETMCNVESSRSHGVFSVRVISAEPTPWGGEVTRDGRLSLVDLSGSENIKRSGAVGDRAKEAAAIGQSLLALGRVIKALVQHAPHIPYRESKLTRVLGDSLGGNAFTAIILNITPNSGMLDETLNTLTYAKMAQSVQNTPKQQIANKVPTDEATTRGGGASQLTPSAGAPNLSCNIAKELKRWREGARFRLLSSASSRSAHIRPWEGKIPIYAPPQQVSPRSFSRSHNDQNDGKAALLPLPQRQNVEKAARRGDGRRRRPATAGGAVRTRSMAQTAGGLAGKKEALGITPRGGGGGEATLASAALARAGLSSRASESDFFLSTRPHDRHRDERAATWRMFDSTAAKWVHTAVLRHGARRTPATATGAPRVVAGGTSSAAAGAAAAGAAAPGAAAPASAEAGQGEDVGGASLTPAAKSAIEEIFDRYDREQAGRGFLLRTEIAALQEIWTRPDAEPPPPPRLPPNPKKRAPRKPPQQALTAPNTYTYRAARSAAGSAPLEVSGARESGSPFDKRVLTRPAFVEFCRRAAARDAIFVRHLFARSGYDHRLELTVPPIDSATSLELVASSPAGQRKGSVVSERRKPKDSNCNNAEGNYHTEVKLAGSGSTQGSRGQPRLRRGGSLEGGGGGKKSSGKGIVPSTSPPAADSQDRGMFAHGNDEEVRCLASGGLVDPVELWLWTEDERDHGERENLDGLLSRGGGAHVSRTAAAAAIVGVFASTKGPRGSAAAATTTAPDIKENGGGTPPTGESHGTEARREASVGGLPEANMAGDEGGYISASTTPTGEVDASTPVCGAAPPDGALASGAGGPRVASRGPSEKCEWCGVVVVAGEKASHSAAYCDEEFVRVPNAR